MQLKYNIQVLTNKTSLSSYFASITTLISKFTALNNSIPTLVYALSPQADQQEIMEILEIWNKQEDITLSFRYLVN